MAEATNQFNPDYAVAPGSILEEHLEVKGMSRAEFARRCGRSTRLISEIISGKAPLKPRMAFEFERILGLGANVWLGIEADYRLHRAKKALEREAAVSVKWVKTLPVKELVKREYIQQPKSNEDAVSKLLAFFQVGSVEAWFNYYGLSSGFSYDFSYGFSGAAYCYSPNIRSDEGDLAIYRRLGEIEAQRQECKGYNKSRFHQAIRDIRNLTREPIPEALQQATKLCNEAGVALVLVNPLPKMVLSGAAWWLRPDKAVIELTAQCMSDDQLWLTFFHEAAHILLHNKKDIFIDEKIWQGKERQENEADEWAANTLVSKADWEGFVATLPRGEEAREVAVESFAQAQGITAGIVVGMLQHKRLILRKHLNHLKCQLNLEGLVLPRSGCFAEM